MRTKKKEATQVLIMTKLREMIARNVAMCIWAVNLKKMRRVF